VTHVAYGADFTLLLTKDFKVWSIGSNIYGQLGHSGTGLGVVPINDNISSIVAGTGHSMALSYAGYVYTWGNNNQGQLGIGSNQQISTTPTMVTFPLGENITCISAGTLHSTALGLTGTVYTWGSNQYGQLGTQSEFRSFARTPIGLGRGAFDGDSIVAVQCGEYHTMVATSLAAYTFGLNTYGQLGRPGYDQWQPAQPILWVPSKYVPQPTYPSYILGSQLCPNNPN
jgi:alpha-tubulin suppressor-like RCC1 family protein